MSSLCLALENTLTHTSLVEDEAIKQLFRGSEGVVEAIGYAMGSCKNIPTLNRGKQQMGNHRGVEHLGQNSLLLGCLNVTFDEFFHSCEIEANRLMDFRLLYGRFVNKSSDFAAPATVPLESKVLVKAFERGGFSRNNVFEYRNFAGRNIFKYRVKQVQLSGEVMIEASLANAAESVEIMGAGRFKSIVPKQLAGCAK